jgi:hypothetical protein
VSEQQETRVVQQPEETCGVGYDLIVGAAVAAPVVTPIVAKVTEHLLNRPAKEPPPKPWVPPSARDE